jgi:hypothetical protein
MAWGSAALVVSLPNAAWACAVCFSGRTEETRAAFGISTAGMTVLPLFMIAAFAWWIRRRARRLAEADSLSRRAVPARLGS